MKYFKNTELAKLYHVSEKSVRNWVDAAVAGKLKLELHEHNGKRFIANTAQNTEVVEGLVEKGKKYKNRRAYKTVTPQAEFYEVYDPKEVFDIMSNIEIHREIPHAYSYFDGGAKYWDLYTHKLLDEQTPNPLTKTIELLALNTSYIDDLISRFGAVNVIDLGVGNCLPVRDWLAHLLDKGLIKRYIGIDTSKDMLQIAESNINDWFKGQLQLEGEVRNVIYDRFSDLVAADSLHGSEPTANLVLFLGSTIANFRDPDHALRTIGGSMNKDDYLLLSLKLDTERARRYFDFGTGSEGPTLDLQEKVVLDLLNIDASYYEVEQFFDESNMARQIQVRLKVDLAIDIQVGDGHKVLEINKGESVLLWRALHKSMIDVISLLDRNGFDLIQATRSRDEENVLIICKIKTD
ncbi:MAG TPA: L-histidine N(alpha)-methyltransferase [Candidatus Saccharimonadales bacterium]|nr:L-histidine N(alpha)-methyltransferase [Candidatus Saccharimonadales bacterium]